jgi:hypothetical protein
MYIIGLESSYNLPGFMRVTAAFRFRKRNILTEHDAPQNNSNPIFAERFLKFTKGQLKVQIESD